MRTCLFDYIIEESGSKPYKVQFDDGPILAVVSEKLQIEQASANLPPSEHPQPASHAASSDDLAKGEDPDEAEDDNVCGDWRGRR
jgi:hypothetical protein